jgi:hypothetical protein
VQNCSFHGSVRVYRGRKAIQVFAATVQPVRDLQQCAEMQVFAATLQPVRDLEQCAELQFSWLYRNIL